MKEKVTERERGVVVNKLVVDTITSVMGFSHSAYIWGLVSD